MIPLQSVWSPSLTSSTSTSLPVKQSAMRSAGGLVSGVAVVIEGAHQCMTTRGITKPGVSMVTRRLLGVFQTDVEIRREFLAMICAPRSACG